MVVGHVQSGKTANYIGLISKAADSGYMVIIVLARTPEFTEKPRTQNRIDRILSEYQPETGQPTGVAKFGMERKANKFHNNRKRLPQADSKCNSDGSEFHQRTRVVCFEKKINPHLRTCIKMAFRAVKQEIMNAPMLLIDDEADHASVNTNASDKNPTAINYAIRNLLSLFPKSSYIGYTATPFANIFIDPESEGDMQNGEKYRDLFPRDFILSLDPPDNYVGPE